MTAYPEIVKWGRAMLILCSLAVAWLQGIPNLQFNWAAAATFLSGGTMISVIIMAVRVGTWKGAVDQRLSTLKERLDAIDQRGCGAARQLHIRDGEGP